MSEKQQQPNFTEVDKTDRNLKSLYENHDVTRKIRTMYKIQKSPK